MDLINGITRHNKLLIIFLVFGNCFYQLIVITFTSSYQWNDHIINIFLLTITSLCINFKVNMKYIFIIIGISNRFPIDLSWCLRNSRDQRWWSYQFNHRRQFINFLFYINFFKAILYCKRPWCLWCDALSWQNGGKLFACRRMSANVYTFGTTGSSRSTVAK